MKIVWTDLLVDRGGFSSSPSWITIRNQIESCMQRLEWPEGSGKFLLHDQPGKKRGEGSGVKPIKEGFIICLQRNGWHTPQKLDIATRRKPGPVDAAFQVGDQYFALEWETGNISSSHRSLNKMVLGMMKGVLIGGALIVPTRAMYRYLTDRVGNYEELEPYFDVWRNSRPAIGLLAVIAIEHDASARRCRE